MLVNDSGLSLLLTNNALPFSESYWSYSSGFTVTNLSIDADLDYNAINLDISFDELPMTGAELTTDLPIVFANSYYNISVCS